MSNLTPITREEQFYAAILKGSADDLPAPITRQEEYLYAIAKQGGPGGTVNSVNGKMGNVVLDAEDVGAAEKEVTDTIAPTEDGTTLSQDYLIGDQFIRDNVLYAAKVDLTQGALWSTLVLDTDYEVARDVSEQLTSLKEALTNTKDSVTNIDITGSTNNTGSTIASGTFFYLNGTLVRAKTSIANGATLTLNTNYELVTAGGLNELNSDNRLPINQTVDFRTILGKQANGYYGLYVNDPRINFTQYTVSLNRVSTVNSVSQMIDLTSKFSLNIGTHYLSVVSNDPDISNYLGNALNLAVSFSLN